MMSYLVSRGVATAIAFLGAVCVDAALPLPPLRVVADVIAAQGFTMEGLWPEQPYRPFFVGTISFTIVGVWENVGVRIVTRRVQRACA